MNLVESMKAAKAEYEAYIVSMLLKHPDLPNRKVAELAGATYTSVRRIAYNRGLSRPVGRPFKANEEK